MSGFLYSGALGDLMSADKASIMDLGYVTMAQAVM